MLCKALLQQQRQFPASGQGPVLMVNIVCTCPLSSRHSPLIHNPTGASLSGSKPSLLVATPVTCCSQLLMLHTAALLVDQGIVFWGGAVFCRGASTAVG
jgi:hypothetical protein